MDILLSHLPMSSISLPSITVAPGAAIYSTFVLTYIYDIFVLWFSCTYVWGCSTTSFLLPYFRSHFRPRKHLDVGVGTGYFLAESLTSASSLPGAPPPLPAGETDITLVDLSASSLSATSGRLKRVCPGIKRVRAVEWDIEKPLPLLSRSSAGGKDVKSGRSGREAEKFDSISMIYLLHCMPGPPSRKFAIFEHLKHNLLPPSSPSSGPSGDRSNGRGRKEGGVLFGATVLNRGVQHNWIGRYFIHSYNRRGIFSNLDDGAEDLLRALKANFRDVKAQLKGTVLVWEARDPIV